MIHENGENYASIYSYRGREYCVSIWLGKCGTFEELDDYLSTVYIDEENLDDEGLEKFFDGLGLFLESNKNRPCEEELRNCFYDFYNQFEYDFGLAFDGDFREANVLEAFSDDIYTLLNMFSSYGTFIENVAASVGNPLPQAYNAAVILYDFKYDGRIKSIAHENVKLDFIGSFNYRSEGEYQNLTQREFERAYRAKMDDDIYFMNDFCSVWDGKAGIKDIPYFIKLFSSTTDTCEQDEFVAAVLSSIVKKDIKEATNSIVQNLGTLPEDELRECMFYIVMMLLYDNKDNMQNLAIALLSADDRVKNEMTKQVSRLGMTINNERGKIISEEFLSVYRNLKNENQES